MTLAQAVATFYQVKGDYAPLLTAVTLPTAAPAADLPLVLDLSGGGIQLRAAVSQTVPVFFDRLANGQRQWTDWIGAGNGFVVLDKSGKGVIDSESEILSGAFAPGVGSGLGALASLAVPGATAFTAKTALIDPATGKSYFKEVAVWVDANGNGQCDPGELHSLSALGITAISLLAGPAKGASIAATTSYSLANGKTSLFHTPFAKTKGPESLRIAA